MRMLEMRIFINVIVIESNRVMGAVDSFSGNISSDILCDEGNLQRERK